MQNLVVLGAGTAGTMVANAVRRRLDDAAWQVTVVDQDAVHHYQPGYLFVPFGTLAPDAVTRPRRRLLRDGVELRIGAVEAVQAEDHTVRLVDGTLLPYDVLVIATGVTPRPDQTPGVDAGPRRGIHSFYTLEGAIALRDALAAFDGGRLVVHITELPIKCPVAPLEFAFLADAHLRERGLRDRTQLTYATPLDGAFTKPIAARRLGHMLDERGIALATDFMVEQIDVDQQQLVSYDDRRIPFDLLVTVPLNMGADFIARSGLGDELNCVPVDRATLQSAAHPDIFAVGDAADLPTSKAGSTAHFSIDVLVDNILHHLAGEPLDAAFDGHANCFVESGDGKALLIDFNYDTEPLPGRYPVPRVGPFSLLEETAANHRGKQAFRWAYWHVLLPGRPIPLPSQMSMAGKIREEQVT